MVSGTYSKAVSLVVVKEPAEYTAAQQKMPGMVTSMKIEKQDLKLCSTEEGKEYYAA